ncbi:hypothetical protein [Halobacillus sp. A5]|uniref:hypothetical protein n=1 Tax=Halobacillus sp. A5 TaxID=2880263 RepID=UPI0020A64061|nr:hypothetical protein [Halobacillus sp. A5]MCP3026622.1 hypothetical protein [Halobacillus sp. A5]
MGKFLFVILSVLVVLVGCGTDEEDTQSENEDTTSEEEVQADEEESKEESQEVTSSDQVKSEIEYGGMSEEDTLEDITFENGEINAVIRLAEDDLLSTDDSAMTRYSQSSDHLLQFDGWDVLTIEYVDIGEASFSRDQAESNESGGEFFPTSQIEKQIQGN